MAGLEAKFIDQRGVGVMASDADYKGINAINTALCLLKNPARHGKGGGNGYTEKERQKWIRQLERIGNKESGFDPKLVTLLRDIEFADSIK